MRSDTPLSSSVRNAVGNENTTPRPDTGEMGVHFLYPHEALIDLGAHIPFERYYFFWTPPGTQIIGCLVVVSDRVPPFAPRGPRRKHMHAHHHIVFLLESALLVHLEPGLIEQYIIKNMAPEAEPRARPIGTVAGAPPPSPTASVSLPANVHRPSAAPDVGRSSPCALLSVGPHCDGSDRRSAPQSGWSIKSPLKTEPVSTRCATAQ